MPRVHAENRARVEAALSQVPEPFRTTLILRDIEGFVYEEVAEMQGVNLGTVKSRLVRGRACLKALLTAPEPQRESGSAVRNSKCPWERRRDERLQCSAGRIYGLSGRPVDRTRDAADRRASGRLPGVRPGVEVAARRAVVAGRAGSGAGAGRPAAADSRGRQPGAGAQPPQLFARLGSGLEKHRGSVPAAGRARALPARCCCWARSSCWSPCLPSRRRRRPRPTSLWATPPRRICSISPTRRAATTIGAISGPVVVEVYINDAGEVYDYRIVSGPTDAATRSQVENLLLFSRFEPARFFGQPVRGLAVLSFSGVSVRG